MQVVWSRVLAMIIGSSTYAFSIVLALFLLGLALGAYLISAKKNLDAWWLRRSVLLIEILTAFTLFLSLRITSAAPNFLIAAGFRLGINSWTGLLALQIGAAALLILLPSILMGMVMPLVLMWAGNRADRNEIADARSPSSVRLVGYSYALNTSGAIAGSIIAAFVLIPKTSTRFTIFCVAALSLIVGGIAYQPRSSSTDRALMRSLAMGAAVTLVLVMFVAWPRLNLNALSAGAYDSYVRVLARSQWMNLIQGLDTPAASPFAVSYFSLPQHVAFIRQVTAATPGTNLLPDGDFEKGRDISENWQIVRNTLDEVEMIARLARSCAGTRTFATLGIVGASASASLKNRSR